jgi:hypothetical protein
MKNLIEKKDITLSNQDDFYFAPFSDQRRSLRVKWNMGIERYKTGWDDYLINAEVEYQNNLQENKRNYNSAKN